MQPRFLSRVKTALGLLTPQGAFFPPPSLHADGDCNQDVVVARRTAGANLGRRWCLHAASEGSMAFPKSAARISSTTAVTGLVFGESPAPSLCLVPH